MVISPDQLRGQVVAFEIGVIQQSNTKEHYGALISSRIQQFMTKIPDAARQQIQQAHIAQQQQQAAQQAAQQQAQQAAQQQQNPLVAMANSNPQLQALLATLAPTQLTHISSMIAANPANAQVYIYAKVYMSRRFSNLLLKQTLNLPLPLLCKPDKISTSKHNWDSLFLFRMRLQWRNIPYRRKRN
jgi:hypothetical protein